MSNLILDTDIETKSGIGGKAKNLQQLKVIGALVPAWLVIPEEVLLEQLGDHKTTPINTTNLSLPEHTNEGLIKFFGENAGQKKYAVRSSAMDEDGKEYSFAGLYESHLNVSFEEIETKVIDIWKSTTSERVKSYRQQNNLDENLGIAVVVQEMIEPDVSGVAFGLDPVTNDASCKVVSSVYGLGEALVSGALNADTFKVSASKIESDIAIKNQKMISSTLKEGTELIDVALNEQKKPSLSITQIREIEALLSKLELHFKHPQDIEFAYKNDKLYLLQTRPITTKNEEEGEYILWDNSNIIESYPGITTPLTFSFILKMYETVYRQFVGILGMSEPEIETHKNVFANTLGLVRGRVYYNLLSWYKMLAMLPGYSINAEFMENMMGVKERFNLQEDYRMNKGKARFRIVKMVFKMIALQMRLPKERRLFLAQLNTVISQYQSMDFTKMDSSSILEHYHFFEKSLLLKWKAPLINDLFAMIWFGLLQKQTEKHWPEHSNIHNDLLCASKDIISVEPIHKSMAISSAVLENKKATELFLNHKADEIWTALNKNEYPEILRLIQDYIVKFGERCVGELKLETISYSQKPELFIRIIKSYVEQGLGNNKNKPTVENKIRENAELIVAKTLKGKGLKNWWFQFVLNKARDLVSNRENLRYERTRGFGMVRTMFSALGEKWCEAGLLINPRDIFYLELNEVKSMPKNTDSLNIQTLISKRKAQFKAFSKQQVPEERFYTYGHNFSDDYIFSKDKIEPITGDLSGIGCCPGRIQAKVRIVTDPTEIDSLNGDILVTSSTDPGWVTLFPTASAIIVERGSLLSHSAIVSREMGIPCIVSVTGLLRTLKSGDEILMDGSTGEIKIIA